MLNPLALALTLAAAAPPAAEPPAPAVPARPLRPIRSLFRNGDYPYEALMFRAQGSAEFRAIVGVNGRVRDCRIVRSSWVRLFGRLTCSILRERARFEPARDAAGNPVEDVVTDTVWWGIASHPDRVPPPR
jgi:periplasmic protein TonB